MREGETLKLIDAIEEIQERVQSTLTPKSIIRKINIIRDQLIRHYEDRVTLMTMDLLEGIPMYPLNIPVDSVVSVLVGGHHYPFAQFNGLKKTGVYYFIVDGALGIYPTPKEYKQQGLSIFFKKSLPKLSEEDFQSEIGLDKDFDMLVVWGVLKDITNGNDHYEYKSKYNDLLHEFLATTSNAEPAAYQIVSEGWY